MTGKGCLGAVIDKLGSYGIYRRRGVAVDLQPAGYLGGPGTVVVLVLVVVLMVAQGSISGPETAGI